MVFSRSDRILIVENIDKITDKIEIVAHKLLLYETKIPDNMKEGIKEISALNCQIGDKVAIVETRPLSKDKYFRLLTILENSNTENINKSRNGKS